jgi:cytidine deaminase
MPFAATEFEKLLELIAQPERDQLLQQINDDPFSGCLKTSEIPAIELAHKLLDLAAHFSVAPISGLHIGAVAVSGSGRLYLGANMEFVGAPLSASLHAEQSAVLNAWMHGETSIDSLVISHAPCGYCRQFLNELSCAKSLEIIVEQTRTSLSTLLPMPFGAPRKLGHGLLDSPSKTLENIHPIDTTRAHRALNAAQRSYTPYTHASEGFVIECADGKVVAGRAAESIAFNPSVPAFLCALNQRNLSKSRNYTITGCTQAKIATALHSPSELAISILRGISNAEIETVLMEGS